jgi:hypothetical protein
MGRASSALGQAFMTMFQQSLSRSTMTAVPRCGFIPTKIPAQRRWALMVKMLWKFYARSDSSPQSVPSRCLPDVMDQTNRHDSKNPIPQNMIMLTPKIVPTVSLFTLNRNSLVLTSFSILSLLISRIIGKPSQRGTPHSQGQGQAISNPMR